MKLIQSIRRSSHATMLPIPYHPPHNTKAAYYARCTNGSSSLARYAPPLFVRCAIILASARHTHRLHSIMNEMRLFCCRTLHSNIQKTTDYWRSPSINITKMLRDCPDDRSRVQAMRRSHFIFLGVIGIVHDTCFPLYGSGKKIRSSATMTKYKQQQNELEGARPMSRLGRRLIQSLQSHEEKKTNSELMGTNHSIQLNSIAMILWTNHFALFSYFDWDCIFFSGESI